MRALELLAAYKTSAAQGAAWDDLVTAAESSHYDDFCAQREVFLDIVRLNNHDLTSFGTHSVAIDVLADSASGFAIAFRMLGEDTTLAGVDPLQRAGSTIDERIDLVHRVWMSEARDAHNIVWLTFERAMLDSNGPTRVGRVSFFPCSRLLWQLEDSEDSNELPAEAWNNREEVLAWCPEDTENQLTVAMVDLGRGPVGGAVAMARDICEATLDLFGRRSDRSWLYAGQMMHFIDGRVGPSGRGRGSRRTDEWRPYGRDNVAEALIDHDGQIVLDLPIARLREPLDLLQVLRRTASPLTATLTAATRGIELVRVNATECGSWQIFSRDFCRDRWIVSEAIREFIGSLFYVDSDHRRNWVEPQADATMLSEMVGRLLTSDGMANLQAMHDNALSILGALEKTWVPTRRLKRAMQIMSPSSAYRLLNRLSHRFDLHLARVSRCRNSITHGGSDCMGSSKSVERFSRHLGFFALNSYVDSLALGEAPSDTLAARRDQASQELTAIGNGDFTSVVAARG